MFDIRALKEEDYDHLLIKWWKDWRWTAPLRDFLPENGLGGVMIEENGIPVVAGFLYLTNSSVAWIEFIISNIEYKDRAKRKEAIELLIFHLCQVADSCGKKYIYTSVKNKSLKESFEAVGFVSGTVKADEMIIRL